MVQIKDKRFLECLDNTIKDFQNKNIEELNELRYIQKNKSLDVVSVGSLYKIIKFREMNIDFVKRHQDKKSFKMVNKEHAYMKHFIERYFVIKDTGSTPEHLSFFVGKKESLA